MLASDSKQLEYEQKVLHVDITKELISGWFDDTYHPNDTSFLNSFTTEQLAHLSAFNQYFDDRIDMLPKSSGTVRTWLSSPVWREVMEYAAKTLQWLV